MASFFRNNGLTVVLILLFLGSIIGQWLAGVHFENEELMRHGEEPIGAIAFLADPQFLSTVFENWESEFLQMSAYVVLTAFLFQKGSAESEDPNQGSRDGPLRAMGDNRRAPAAVRKGPAVRWVYAHSLGITMFILFVASFLLHWNFSAELAAEEAQMHGEQAKSLGQYLTDPQLWFESFQNWQSEFLSTAVLVVLSIWLRQKDSPESKPVTASHDKTGTE
jgi:glycerol uptake facilitator-like aquaporin